MGLANVSRSLAVYAHDGRARTGPAGEHAPLLARIEAEYGVPRRFILAIWGMESQFGRITGGVPVFQALATLAWDPRRAELFRGEIFAALSIVANGDITVAGRPPWDTLHPHRVVRPVGAVRKMSAPSFKNLKSTSARASRALSGSSRKSDTKCEVLLRSRLWRMGFRFRKNVRGLPGVPDIVFPRERVAIFCDGDFWHGRNWESRQEKLRCGANPDYWIAKISRNMERDVAQSAALRRSGWRVLRFWESRILKSPESVARRVGDVVRRRRSRL